MFISSESKSRCDTVSNAFDKSIRNVWTTVRSISVDIIGVIEIGR